MAADKPRVSVVIPTYNRARALVRTLDALTRQTYPHERLEVIVVDDGATDSTRAVCNDYPTLNLHYLLQDHAGGTQAKNRGARASEGDLLVFLDDDITVVPGFVQCLAAEHSSCDRLIVVGTLHSVDTAYDYFAEDPDSKPGQLTENCASVSIPFTECLGGFFSIRRCYFMELGLLHDPAPGCWPNWEDVDFAYRAHLKGFSFRRSLDAVGYHRDHVLTDLATSADRWHRAACAAVLLFHKHPELQSHLPMFRDKMPIVMGRDSPALIVDKLFHRVTAWRSLQCALERLAHLLKTFAPWPPLLRLLHRWIISSYIYQGYREGLREYGPIQPPSSDIGGS